MTIKKLYLRCITRTSSLLYCSTIQYNIPMYIVGRVRLRPIMSSSRDPSYKTHTCVICKRVYTDSNYIIGTSIVHNNRKKIYSNVFHVVILSIKSVEVDQIIIIKTKYILNVIYYATDCRARRQDIPV
uniref:Uncharacterized protein n=1 Tax=Schizaphis graminum TaxID=13262 RepID=A0A2S2NBK3_SCHGA